jgi:hypothetical protein
MARTRQQEIKRRRKRKKEGLKLRKQEAMKK